MQIKTISKDFLISYPSPIFYLPSPDIHTYTSVFALISRDNGRLSVPLTAPHTITKWVGNSVCVSETAGLGISPMASITTFQPFFLSFTLPYAAVRGERIPIMITVYNYLDKCLHVSQNISVTQQCQRWS